MHPPFSPKKITHLIPRNEIAPSHANLPLQLVLGQVVQHPDFIKKADGAPYTVYTPYAKKWKSMLPESMDITPALEHIHTPAGIHTEAIPDAPTSDLFPAGEAEALQRLERFTTENTENTENY